MYDREVHSELFHRVGAVEQGQKDLKDRLDRHSTDTKDQFRLVYRALGWIALGVVIIIASQPKLWDVVVPAVKAIMK